MKSKHIFSLAIFSMLIIAFVSCKKDDDSKNNENNTPNPTVKSDIKFNESLTYGSMTDQEGNSYRTIQIGNQTWMAENLRTTKYRNGEDIGTTEPLDKNIYYENTPKYQWAYNGDDTKIPSYGRLYTFYVVTDSRNLCPSGWHVPTLAEWDTLVKNTGGQYSAAYQLKETDTLHWNYYSTDVTNSSGFTALPGGYRQGEGIFQSMGRYGQWWSSTQYDNYFGYGKNMEDASSGVSISNVSKSYGYSVRCVKD